MKPKALTRRETKASYDGICAIFQKEKSPYWVKRRKYLKRSSLEKLELLCMSPQTRCFIYRRDIETFGKMTINTQKDT